jgi:hypothetical protein
MDYKTFNDWSSKGYKILKGSKATWIDNVPMFSENQVVKSVRPSYGNHWKGCVPDYPMDNWGHNSPWEDAAYDASWGGD